MKIENNKIAIVGDPHIAPIPGGRIDDYFHVGLDKITQIANTCEHVVFLGDMFSCPKIDEKYVNALISHLLYLMTSNGNKFYSIIGNHDVANELEVKLPNSSLGTLAASGCIRIIYPEFPVEIGQYNFNTVPVRFRDVKQFLQDKHYTDKDVLLIHHEYETGTNRIVYEDIKNLGCKHIFFGHDHCPLPNGRIIYPECTVYRSGSLMRNLATEYNFTRQIYYYIIDGENISCGAVEQQQAQTVFTQKALTRENYNKKKFVESVDNIIDKYKSTMSKQNKCSIKSALLELNTPERAIYRIKQKYEKFGERFD